MTPRRRFIAALTSAAVLTLVLGAGSADAQRAAQRAPQRVPAPAGQSRQAVPRPPASARPPSGGHYYNGGHVYHPYYYGRPYYGYGGFYGGYYYYPYSFSFGIGAGYPYSRYSYYPYYPYYYGYAYDPIASLRLRVIPHHAEVFIDGFYAGNVDEFDGSFQRLRLYPGHHTVEVFLPGHRMFRQNVYLQPGKTFTIEATLQPLAPGEPEPERPSAEAVPRTQTRGIEQPPALDLEVTER